MLKYLPRTVPGKGGKARGGEVAAVCGGGGGIPHAKVGLKLSWLMLATEGYLWWPPAKGVGGLARFQLSVALASARLPVHVHTGSAHGLVTVVLLDAGFAPTPKGAEIAEARASVVVGVCKECTSREPSGREHKPRRAHHIHQRG